MLCLESNVFGALKKYIQFAFKSARPNLLNIHNNHNLKGDTLFGYSNISIFGHPIPNYHLQPVSTYTILITDIKLY